MVLLAHNLEQNVGATKQYVTDAVSHGSLHQLRGIDATQGCGMELTGACFSPILPPKRSSRMSDWWWLSSEWLQSPMAMSEESVFI